VIEEVLSETNSGALESIQAVLAADAEARELARQRVAAVRKMERPQATSFV
jgi:1-deoxy-D-xylulose 5-phosphate reductoisomerase